MLNTARNVWRVFNRSDFDLIAASVAFWGVFSIFPAAAAFIAVFGLVADPSAVKAQLVLLQGVIPEDVYLLFEAQLDRLLATGRSALGWATVLSVVLALWASRSGVSALLVGVNAIYDAPKRSFFGQLAIALGMTVALLAVGVVSLFSVVIAPVILAFVPAVREWAWLLAGLRWAAALFVIFAAVSLFYHFGPNVRRTKRPPFITIGAFVAMTCWFISSYGLSYYIANFGNYNQVYGSIGAFIALMLWLYVSAFFIILGAAINNVLYLEGRGEDLLRTSL